MLVLLLATFSAQPSKPAKTKLQMSLFQGEFDKYDKPRVPVARGFLLPACGLCSGCVPNWHSESDPVGTFQGFFKDPHT